MKYITDIVVIGAGPIGLFTVFQAGMLNMKCCVIDALNKVGGQCTAVYPEKPIYDIPSHPVITAEQLINNLVEQAAPFKPIYCLNQIANKIVKNDNSITVLTNSGYSICCKAVVIAAGFGAFSPARPPIENILDYENKSVFYTINTIKTFYDKNIVIAGGGDSAADWTVELAKVAKKIYLVHRRKNFRCAPSTRDKIEKLVQNGKVELIIPYTLNKINGHNGLLQSINVRNITTKEDNLLIADFLLPFFGLASNLDAISNWELSIENNHIIVNSITLQTNHKRIYAVGDIASYPGKLKLILSGFSEVAMACHNIYNIVYPDLPLNFQYSTTKGIVEIKQ